MFKLSIKSLKDYFYNKKKEGKQLLFHESIGDADTSKEEMMKNLIKVLEKNGFKYKGSYNKDE
tara:strand:+ start:2120 stop:2308 length:189 start_codon:yes stop_codon:yes gene_type:complete